MLAVGSATAGAFHARQSSRGGSDGPSAASANTDRSAAPSARSSTGSPSSTASAGPTGTGRMIPVTVPGADSAGRARAVTYALEVEEGLGIDRRAVATKVAQTLRDPRGWQTQDHVRFVQVTPAQRKAGTRPTVTISLASPGKVNKMCAPLDTDGEWSCGRNGHATLNYRRWADATASYGGTKNLQAYRTYQINHEVGHLLGHPHARCPGKGKPAPVMVQQSMSLQGCKANGWPTVTKG